MSDADAAGMREFWEARANENAAWYVDTSLSYDEPDMERFWATGRAIVDEAFVKAPVQPDRHELAVELGCGLGRICLALRDHFDNVVGLDISQSMIDQARALVDRPGVTFEVIDGVTFAPVQPDTVDFVTTFTVLQHQSSEALVVALLQEAARVLRRGGVLAAQWNNTDPKQFRLTRARYALRRLVRRERQTTGARQFLGTAVPRPTVAATLDAAGMDVVGYKGEDTLFCWVWARKR